MPVDVVLVVEQQVVIKSGLHRVAFQDEIAIEDLNQLPRFSTGTEAIHLCLRAGKGLAMILWLWLRTIFV
jgi:hypothetical protein